MKKHTLELLVHRFQVFRAAQSRYGFYTGRLAVDLYLRRRRDNALTELKRVVDPLVAMWATRLDCEVSQRNAIMLSLLASEMDAFDNGRPVNDAISHLSGHGYLPERLGRKFQQWTREVSDKVDNHPTFPIDLNEVGFVCTDSHRYVNENDAWYCDACDEYHDDTVDTVEAVTRLYSPSRYSSDAVCSNTDTFYCNASDRHYLSDNFCQAEDEHGDTVCNEWCEMSGWYYDHSNDCWSEYGPSNSIPDYHGGDRSAIYDAINEMRRTTLTDRKERRYGIEMEVEFGCSSDRQEFFDAFKDNTPACMELDGSLSDERGLEIISPPIKLSEHRDGTWFSEMLQSARSDHGATAWRHRASYGCHVNVDLRGVTDGQVALFVALVNNMAPLYSMVSGRKRVYNGSYKCIDRFDPTLDKNFYGVDHAIDLTDKYQPVRVANLSSPESRFAEVRTFGANLRPFAMLEYIELVDATLCYAQYLSTLPYQLDLFDAIPLTAYPVAEAFNQSVVGFLRWLPSEYKAFRKFLTHHNVPMDETADQFISDKVAAL